MTSFATNSVAVGHKADIQIPAVVHIRTAVAVHKHRGTPGRGVAGVPAGALVGIQIAGCNPEGHPVVGCTKQADLGFGEEAGCILRIALRVQVGVHDVRVPARPWCRRRNQ
jgi:hypothetical protein